MGTELTPKIKNISAVRRDVGMVFQNFDLFPHMTVLENLVLAPCWLLKLPRQKAEEKAMALLERVQIQTQAHKMPGQLSGGQQQRVAIARALCMDPKIMLFDEPTSALDPISAQRIEEQLVTLKEEMTIVVVTHSLQQARRLADHAIFLWMGELVESGACVQVFHTPKDERTQAYLVGDVG